MTTCTVTEIDEEKKTKQINSKIKVIKEKIVIWILLNYLTIHYLFCLFYFSTVKTKQIKTTTVVSNRDICIHHAYKLLQYPSAIYA